MPWNEINKTHEMKIIGSEAMNIAKIENSHFESHLRIQILEQDEKLNENVASEVAVAQLKIE